MLPLVATAHASVQYFTRCRGKSATLANTMQCPGRNEFLVLGTVNPAGMSNDYDGVYLTKNDVSSMVKGKKLDGLPVQLEHTKDPIVGRVLHSWESPEGKLDVLLRLDPTFPGLLASSFVREGLVSELSLGYNTTMKRDDSSGRIVATSKVPVEVTLTKSGARPNTHIHMHTIPERKRQKR